MFIIFLKSKEKKSLGPHKRGSYLAERWLVDQQDLMRGSERKQMA